MTETIGHPHRQSFNMTKHLLCFSQNDFKEQCHSVINSNKMTGSIGEEPVIKHENDRC